MKTKLCTIGVVVLSTLCGNTAFASEHMLVLIDQSGSMFDISVGGDPRYLVARDLARNAVLAAAADREFALWTFTNTSYTEVVPFSAGETAGQIAAAIDALPNPGGSTPLAGSICAAIDQLVAYKETILADKRVELFSDGLENSTPTTDQCWGPDSADHSNPDPFTWEWKVINKARTGSAGSAAHPPVPLIINTDYLFDHETSFAFAFASPVVSSKAKPGATRVEIVGLNPSIASRIGQLPEIERLQVVQKLRLQTPSSLIRSQAFEGLAASESIVRFPVVESAQTVGFYQLLTESTGVGGRYREFTSAMTRLPVLGDVTGDYCVNDDDIAAVRANIGATVAAGNLLDPNQDKVIDVYDYSTVLQNYDASCKSQ